MIEAGIIAFAIIIIGIGSQVFYSHEQEKNRDQIRDFAEKEAVNLSLWMEAITRSIDGQTSQMTATSHQTRMVADSLAPLCKSLADSLTQRMSTIDSDMADLRTRVETGPGKRTLSL